MSAAHTPGPWKAVLQYGTRHIRQDPADWDGRGYQHIASLPSERKGTYYGDMFAANARLIADAPTLLEELENCADLLSTCFPDAPVDSCIGVAITKARAVIAKITGVTP